MKKAKRNKLFGICIILLVVGCYGCEDLTFDGEQPPSLPLESERPKPDDDQIEGVEENVLPIILLEDIIFNQDSSIILRGYAAVIDSAGLNIVKNE